jgi:uncharacterized protein YecT (DUF1311 family)
MKPRESMRSSKQHIARYWQEFTSQPEALAKIKAAERAWIAYRDAYIKATYPAKDKGIEYGSIYPLEVTLLRARLTQRQVTALEDMLQHYTQIVFQGACSQSSCRWEIETAKR